jgi:DNA-binding response OmpR family regulator
MKCATIRNVSKSVQVAPHNSPTEVLAAALAIGLKAMKPFASAEFLARVAAHPEHYVSAGTERTETQSVMPGEQFEVDSDKLLAPAQARLRASLQPGASLEVVPK